MPTNKPYLSVVCPCYNESEVVEELHRRVTAVCRELKESYEIVLINDGSQDDTWDILQRLVSEDHQVVAVNLSRNHGHQLALTAGLHVCQGERVLILDADLQDPPELLPDMLKVMDSGVEVVYGQRRSRDGESWAKRASSSLYYRILTAMSDQPIPLDSGDFRLISRRVLDALESMPEQHRYLRGMISWIGLRQQPIFYDRDARFAGETKYPLTKMVRLAFDGLTAFSTKPLRFATYGGISSILASLLFLTYAIVSWLFFSGSPRGWASMMALVSALGGAQLLALGVIGEYLGRAYEQSKGRPLFLIDEILRNESASQSPGVDFEHSHYRMSDYRAA